MTTAGERVHGSTREQPLARFQDTERAALLPLPAVPYDPRVPTAVGAGPGSASTGTVTSPSSTPTTRRPSGWSVRSSGCAAAPAPSTSTATITSCSPPTTHRWRGSAPHQCSVAGAPAPLAAPATPAECAPAPLSARPHRPLPPAHGRPCGASAPPRRLVAHLGPPEEGPKGHPLLRRLGERQPTAHTDQSLQQVGTEAARQ